MRKIASMAGAGLLSAALLSTANSQPAWADACHPNHCYGIAHHAEPEFDAAYQELWTDCLVMDPSGPQENTYIFVTHEMWLPFAGGKWLESGYIKGGPMAGDVTGSSHFRYFWAEYDGTTFTSHHPMSAVILNYVPFRWDRGGDGRWTAQISNTNVGTTAAVYPRGAYVQTGAETNWSGSVKQHGKSRFLQTYDPARGTWLLASRDNTTATSGVFHVNSNAWERMEVYSLPQICDPLPGGPVGTYSMPSLAQSTQPAGEPANDESVKKAALRAARGLGEKNPNMELVSTKRSKATTGKVDADSDVYLVQMAGKFDGSNLPRPKGYAPVKGNVVTMSIDKKTGLVTDWSLGKTKKDLAQLGSVKKL